MIRDVALYWVGPRLDVDQTLSSLAIWTCIADAANLSLGCQYGLLLVFICSFKNAGIVWGLAMLPLIVMQSWTTAARSMSLLLSPKDITALCLLI